MMFATRVSDSHIPYGLRARSARRRRTLIAARPCAESLTQIGFVLLWSCIMPLLCWGAWAQPGHPHPFPHLFFAAPAPNTTHMAHTHATADPDPAAQPTGASRPNTLLASFFFLGLALRQSYLPRLQAGGHRMHRRKVYARSIWLPVPTPPPRRL